MAKLSVKDGDLYYEEFGDHEEVVFIVSGMGLSGRFYHEFAQTLSSAYRCICPDHRSLGKSTAKMPWTFSVYDIAHDIVRIADKLKIKKFHVIGESYGGMVTMALGIKYPHRCRSLTIINSSIAGIFPRLYPVALYRIVKGMVKKKDWHDAVTANVFSRATMDRNPEIMRRWQDILAAEDFPIPLTRRQTAAALRFFAAPKLKRLKVPALILSGAKDRLVPPVNSRYIAKLIPGSRLEVVDHGGHHLCGEFAETVRDVVLAFHQGLASCHPQRTQ